MADINFNFSISSDMIEDKIKSMRGISFSRCIEQLQKQAAALRTPNHRAPAFLLDDKIIAHSFSKHLGVRCPEIYQANVDLEDIRFSPNTVVKPVEDNSAVGVFIVKSDGCPVYLNKNIKLAGREAAIAHGRDLINSGRVKSKKWMSEEIIYDPNGEIARDLKFYMFYGEVALVLETRRIPKIGRCWYDADENKVDTGKYPNLKFDGKGGYKSVQDLAREISLEIPFPFARLDFLVCGGQAYFGEVTPVPGGYMRFNDDWDRKLGPYFISAAVRLGNDIGSGKEFSSFRAFEKNRSRILSNINAPSSHVEINTRQAERAFV